jgi:hypothetical protein
VGVYRCVVWLQKVPWLLIELILVITGLVPAIAICLYSAVQSKGAGNYVASLTGAQVNDAFRYGFLLQKVPWLLIELFLVMKLPRGATVSKGRGVITGLVTAIPLRADLQLVGRRYPGVAVGGDRRLRSEPDWCAVQRCLSLRRLVAEGALASDRADLGAGMRRPLAIHLT